MKISGLTDSKPSASPAQHFCSGMPETAGKEFRVVNGLAIIELKGVVWSDWGHPQRIGDTLGSLNIEPSFQKTLMAS